MADYFSVERLIYEGAESVATSATNGALPWPSGFFNAPGSYSYPAGYVSTGAFTISEPGLHCAVGVYQYGTNSAFSDCAYFMCWDTSWNNDYSKVKALLSGFSWGQCYGGLDNALSDSALKSTFRTRRLTLTCSPARDFVMARYAEIEIPTRRVALCKGGPLNEFDDNHAVFEFKINGQWFLADVATGSVFEDAGGNPLSLKDIIAAGVSNVTRIELGGNETNPSDGWKPSGGFPYDPYFNTKYRYFIDDWLASVMQIPGIQDADGNFYFYLPTGFESLSSRITAMSPNWRVTTEADFDARFYS